MPFAHINKIRIHYEIYGAGDPVLMVSGLSAPGINWLYQVRDLSQHFQLARLIPKAKLKLIAGGHGFFIEEAEAFNGAVLAFLRRVK